MRDTWDPEHSDIALANRLRVLRAEHRMSQAVLAEAVGVSRKTISLIETGRCVPSTTLALLMARTFRARVEEIFSLEDE